MRTKIFAYKGYIGIMSAEDVEGLLLPLSEENGHCVVNAMFIDISKEAINLLKDIKKTKKKTADIDIFKGGYEMVLVGWLGGYMTAFKPSEAEASIGYDPDLLMPADGVEATEDFKNFIDNIN